MNGLLFSGMGIAHAVWGESLFGGSKGSGEVPPNFASRRQFMAFELANLSVETNGPALGPKAISGNQEGAEATLLMEAFEVFTQASSSLESSFITLQAKVQRLTEELEAKNLELEKSLEEKQEARDYLRTILERLPCGVLALDENGGVTLCNSMASGVLRKSPDKAARDKKRQPFINMEMRNAFAASAAGNKSEVEIPFVAGKKKKYLATSGTPLTDRDGHIKGTLHIIRDITEVKALQEKNQRNERLSAMGEMAVELAHEIRNPLGSIELFASLLMKECDGDCRRWAENIRVGTRTLNTIVSNMLHFSNPISPLFSEVNIHEVLQEIAKFCDPIMSQRQINLELDLKATVAQIWADQELIKQMLLNLIFNAIKAMPSQGFLKLQTRNLPDSSGRPSFNGIEIKIVDNGIGIPPENLNSIFDPFFTTNKNGTGLGLSIVHQIVERHSGTIRVASKVNQGTAFTIVFKALS
jgi:nitrogen fixation/metabolism regulation signal transduction histidine kinase